MVTFFNPQIHVLTLDYKIMISLCWDKISYQIIKNYCGEARVYKADPE